MANRRKANFGSILRQTERCWQIAPANPGTAEEIDNPEAANWRTVASAAVSHEELAAAVADLVEQESLSEDVLLALDSKSCLPVSFSINQLSELRDRQALSYRVEELLPLAAEDFIADVIHKDKQVLGIATPVRELLPIVAALEEQGLRVQNIVPFAITAIQGFLDNNKDVSCDFIVWQDGNFLEVFRDRRRNPDWRHLPAEATALQQFLALELLRRDGQLNIVLLNVDSDICDQVAKQGHVHVKTIDTSPLPEHARRQAASILGGKSQAWCELRRGPLIIGDPNRAFRRDLQWCQWALALLLMAAAFFFWNRSRQYEGMAAIAVDRQRDIYSQIFPKSKVPNAVVRRLKSEEAKLAGARGKEAAVERPPSALNVLFDVLSGIPKEVRVQVQQIRVEDGKLYMDADVRSVGKAGEIADGLERQGFSIDPPTTEQYDAERVSVRINGMSTKQPEIQR